MAGISLYGLQYVEILPTTDTVNAGAGWVDWDLSAICPGAKYVPIQMSPSVAQLIGCREKGSSADRKVNSSQSVTITKLSETQVIQVYDASGVNATYYTIWGYFK